MSDQIQQFGVAPPDNPQSPLAVSHDLGELFTALSALHGDIATVEKDERANLGSYSYRYLSLPAFRAAVNPLLAKHGLSLTQHGVGTSLMTCLGHSSGQFIMSSFDLRPIIAEEGVSPQDLGGILTYIERYMCLPAVGLASSEDDDAAGAKAGPKRSRQEPPTAAYKGSEPGGNETIGRHAGSVVTSATKSSTSKGKPMWDVAFDDGMIAKTFSETLGGRAEEMSGTGAVVVRDVVVAGAQGQYRNLEQLDYSADETSNADAAKTQVNWSNRHDAKAALVEACNERGLGKDYIAKLFSDYAKAVGVDSLVKAMPADLEELHAQITAGNHDENETPF